MKTKNQLGFTLIETVVAIGLFTLILAGLLALFTHYYKIYNAQQATARAGGAATQIANELQNTIIQASNIVSSQSISGTTYTTDSDTLVLKIPSINSSGTIITNTYDYVVFYISGSDLYKRLQPGSGSTRPTAYKKITDSLSTISFTYNNGDVTLADKVDIDITVQITAGGRSISHRLKQTLYLRNM